MFDVLPLKLPSLTYCAVMLCVPTERVDVLNEATSFPPTRFRGALPIGVAPSKKFAVPVGVPLPEETVAVNETCCPKNDGFRDEVTVIEVAP